MVRIGIFNKTMCGSKDEVVRIEFKSDYLGMFLTKSDLFNKASE